MEGQHAWSYPPGSTSADLGIGLRLSGWGGYMSFVGIIDEVVVSRLLPGERPALSMARAGNLIRISWTACGTLQAASEIDGQWTDVENPANPYVVTPTASQMFYRLRLP